MTITVEGTTSHKYEIRSGAYPSMFAVVEWLEDGEPVIRLYGVNSSNEGFDLDKVDALRALLSKVPAVYSSKA